MSLGYVPASKVGSELLFDVISTAYERTSLIVTTNPPSSRGPRCSVPNGSPGPRSTASRTAVGSSRKGESYRLQDAKARTSRPAKSVTETVDETAASS
jgi:DNA replication protein DnaC